MFLKWTLESSRQAILPPNSISCAMFFPSTGDAVIIICIVLIVVCTSRRFTVFQQPKQYSLTAIHFFSLSFSLYKPCNENKVCGQMSCSGYIYSYSSLPNLIIIHGKILDSGRGISKEMRGREGSRKKKRWRDSSGFQILELEKQSNASTYLFPHMNSWKWSLEYDTVLTECTTKMWLPTLTKNRKNEWYLKWTSVTSNQVKMSPNSMSLAMPLPSKDPWVDSFFPKSSWNLT